MQATRTRIRLTLITLVNLTALLLFTGSAMAQSVADNIRPVGQVCMADQPCVGATAGGGSSSAPVVATSAATSAAAPASTAPAVPVAAAPEPAVAEVAAFDAAAAFQMNCFACHGTGAAGAPKLDDADAWSERTANGMEPVMANVINGLNAMPPKGLCMTCSDDDLRAIVDYMVSQ